MLLPCNLYTSLVVQFVSNIWSRSISLLVLGCLYCSLCSTHAAVVTAPKHYNGYLALEAHGIAFHPEMALGLDDGKKELPRNLDFARIFVYAPGIACFYSTRIPGQHKRGAWEFAAAYIRDCYDQHFAMVAGGCIYRFNIGGPFYWDIGWMWSTMAITQAHCPLHANNPYGGVLSPKKLVLGMFYQIPNSNLRLQFFGYPIMRLLYELPNGIYLGTSVAVALIQFQFAIHCAIPLLRSS